MYSWTYLHCWQRRWNINMVPTKTNSSNTSFIVRLYDNGTGHFINDLFKTTNVTQRQPVNRYFLFYSVFVQKSIIWELCKKEKSKRKACNSIQHYYMYLVHINSMFFLLLTIFLCVSVSDIVYIELARAIDIIVFLYF